MIYYRMSTTIPSSCSLLSYFVRAEVTSRVDEFLEVNEQLIQKEVAASQQCNKSSGDGLHVFI